MAWIGNAWLGDAGQGYARHGKARECADIQQINRPTRYRRGVAGLGLARQGKARQCNETQTGTNQMNIDDITINATTERPVIVRSRDAGCVYG